MKKVVLLSVALASIVMTGCASTSAIHETRGKSTSTMTKAELNQYNTQRANEVVEAQTKAEKARGNAEAVRQTADAVQSGVSAVRSVLSIFGR